MLLRIKKWVRDFFGFTRAQTNGFLLLLPLMMVALFGQSLWRWYALPPLYDTRADSLKLDSLVALWREESAHDTASASRHDSLFPFDPNRATTTELMALGFSDNMAGRIVKYRERGGKFRVKADLLKIYGLDSTFYQSLQAYVQLPAAVSNEPRTKADRRYQKKASVPFTKYPAKAPRVRQDINLADTAALKAVFGIGSKLSMRIVKYRESLGGFVSMRQLSEIYALDTAVVRRLESGFFVDASFKPKTINVNTATEKEMAAHPYLGKRAARLLVAWRFQHGHLAGLNDLRTTKAVADRDVDNVAPYITF